MFRRRLDNDGLGYRDVGLLLNLLKRSLVFNVQIKILSSSFSDYN